MPKILVIDEDTIVRMTIVQLLEEAGYEVPFAEDGVHGMSLFRCEQPDLVVTDIIMPEQGGNQTITEMRKAKPDVKIIAISGAGASAMPISSRLLEPSVQWTSSQSPSMPTCCSPS